MHHKPFNKVSEMNYFQVTEIFAKSLFVVNTDNVLVMYRNTGCSVTLELTQTVPACCILSTLCAANDPSSDIHVVGNKVNRGEC